MSDKPSAAGRRKAKFVTAYARSVRKKKERAIRRAARLEKLAERRKALKATVKTKEEGERLISAFSTGLTKNGFIKRYYPKEKA